MTSPLRVIILGATSAIAEATVRLYAQENACLLLAGRNADHLNQISADLLARGAKSAFVETLDLSRTGMAIQALDRMIETLGGVDHGVSGQCGGVGHASADVVRLKVREILQNFVCSDAACEHFESLSAQRPGLDLVDVQKGVEHA